MSYQITGFCDQRIGCRLLRKPNEGEFQAVLPGSQLPLPFKDQAQVDILVVSEGIQNNVSDTVLITSDVIDVIAPQNADQINIADNVTLGQEYALGVADSSIVNVSDIVNLSRESEIVVSDAVNEQYADNVELISEHNIEVSNADNEQYADGVTLTLDGEKTVTADDSHCAVVSDVIAINVFTPVAAVKRGVRARYAIYPQEIKQIEEIKEDEFYLSYYLRVADSGVGNVSDTVNLIEHQQIKAKSVVLGVSDNAGNVITLTQKRRKRFVRIDDEILLLAA